MRKYRLFVSLMLAFLSVMWMPGAANASEAATDLVDTSEAATDTADASEAVADTQTSPAEEKFRECIENSGIERVGDDFGSRPFWYPVDKRNYAFYNDPDIPRVLDLADIFTDEEEAEMETLIARITQEEQKDIVVFTDTTDYGLGHNIYAADFYDFNGYGIGDENEGMCLMICMDPDNRGWYACATGTDTRSLYTESSADALDDTLYDYMATGNYGAGVLDWISNIGTLYQKGIPFAPEWYPDRGETADTENAASAPRVVDDAGLFTEEQTEELTAEAKSLSDRYDLDVVISTTTSDYTLGKQTYCDRFYEMNGYGFGDDRSGFGLTLYKSSLEGAFMTYYGSAYDRMTSTNYSRIMDYTSAKAENGDYYEAARTWLKHIEHMERTGRVARPISVWILHIIVALIAALTFSRLAFIGAKKRMQTIRLSRDADACIVGQPTLTVVRDIFLRYYEVRKKVEVQHKSSSGGSHSSSHSSHYSKSYKGSSGRSHSGSGRKF